MGIFDKLFGKKQSEHDHAPQPVKEQIHIPTAKETFDVLGYTPSIPKPVEAQKTFRSFTYEEIEQMIADNPNSSKFRLERQQQTTSMHTMEWEQFKMKSKGSFVALDFETTSLDNSNGYIVEIGAVRVRNGVITDRFHQYVNPNTPMPKDAQAVNHITDDMLVGKPFIFQVVPDILDFIGTDIIVAHNATFDFGFLAQACMNYRFKIPKKWFDSMDLKEVWPGLPNRKLQTFLEAAGIVNKEAHRADSDAEALALLMIESLKK